jgi:hypothetical protein
LPAKGGESSSQVLLESWEGLRASDEQFADQIIAPLLAVLQGASAQVLAELLLGPNPWVPQIIATACTIDEEVRGARTSSLTQGLSVRKQLCFTHRKSFH